MTTYERISHTHCFNQSNPPCGKKAHAQCCLCDAMLAKEKYKQYPKGDYCPYCKEDNISFEHSHPSTVSNEKCEEVRISKHVETLCGLDLPCPVHTSTVSKEKCEHAHCRCMNLDKQCPKKHYSDCIKPSPVAEQEGWKDSYKGKLWSTAVQKCFEAPMVEVAIQHLLRRIDENHQKEISETLSRHNLALVEAVKKMKYGQPLLGTPETTERVMIAVDSALDAVIEIIKPKV
jgi:hypothetical protein